MIYYSNEVDSHETLPLLVSSLQTRLVSSESEVGLSVVEFPAESIIQWLDVLPHSIINCWITPKQLEREEQIALVNEINRGFGIRGESYNDKR